MTTATKGRSKHATPTKVWLDRFRRPTDEDLIAGLEAQGATLFKSARKSLQAIEGAEEVLDWHGIPWRWSFAYWVGAKPARNNGQAPLAYLIPDPETPRLGLPLSGEIIASVKPRSLSKPIREGLVYSTRVGQVYWTCWDLQSKTGLADVLELVRIKRQHLSDN